MSCWWQLLTHRASVQESIVARSIAMQVKDRCRDPVACRAVTTSMREQRGVSIARSVNTRRHDNEPKRFTGLSGLLTTGESRAAVQRIIDLPGNEQAAR